MYATRPVAEGSRSDEEGHRLDRPHSVIFYIGTNPGPAADIARGIGHGIAEAFRNIGVFLRNLAT